MKHPSPRRTLAGLAGLAGTMLALGLLVGCGDDTDASDPDATTSSGTPSSDAPASDPTSGATSGEDPSSGGPEPTVIPVYYVGDTPNGDRLFREFSQSSGVEPLVAAGAAVTAGDPIDPDYRTPWPGGRFASITQTAEAIVVAVPDESWLDAGNLDADLAQLAVQQLVYTLQGTAGKRLPVIVEYDGQRADTLLGVDATGGLKAAPQLEVLAFMNVTEPAEGTAVSDSFTATGRASSFEATVGWTIEDAAGTVVLEGFATADGWLDKLHPWTTKIDVSSLDPGTYTFIARTDDPSGGEGPGPTEDTKRITIE